MQHILFSLFLMYCGISYLHAQTIPHDLCNQAQWITLNESVTGQHNQEASTEADILPAGQPMTCIKSFENDLWYQMNTVEGFLFYRLTITPTICETPAGLQALIIRADSCQPDSFQYILCSNPNKVEPLVLEWSSATPDEHYFLYIDGYDGNRCTFDLKLEGFKVVQHSSSSRSSQTADYNMSDSSYLPTDFGPRFVNNEMLVNWKASTDEDLVEFWVQLRQQSINDFAWTVGRVPPQDLAGAEAEATYTYLHNVKFEQGKPYCYRIVKIYADGRRSYSPFRCETAQLNEDFYISPVFPHDRPKVYKIQFINYLKQDLTFTVHDISGAELKRLVRAKEKKGDGIITIDMQDFAPGRYELRVEGKEERFVRPFLVE